MTIPDKFKFAMEMHQFVWYSELQMHAPIVWILHVNQTLVLTSVLFNVPLEIISLIWRRLHSRMRVNWSAVPNATLVYQCIRCVINRRTSLGGGLQNLGLFSALMTFEQGMLFIVPRMLGHGTSVLWLRIPTGLGQQATVYRYLGYFYVKSCT